MNHSIKSKYNYLILIVLIVSCQSIKDFNEEKIYGKYRWYGIYGVTSSITLNKDKTFIYRWQQGLMNGTTNGNWRLVAQTLVLNSEKQPNDPVEKFQIISEESIPSNHYHLKIMEENNEPMWFVSCTLMNDTVSIHHTVTDTNGVCKIPLVEEGNKIEICFLGYYSIDIPVGELNGNSLIIKMKEKAAYYEYFTNRRWKIKDDKLIDPAIKKDRYVKKNYYEKVKNKMP